ncbi:MAG: SpaA isopeptide-forming pilin-related protein [Eubacteriales bacterium]|nr:SpaA isopeptide-forming pilin-related protein [Eubacteriales bacterium]
MRKILSDAAEYLNQKHRRTVWMRIVSGLACLVVFCTVYALILPAITLEKQEKILACPLNVHQHTEDCYDENNDLICGQANYVVHIHDDNCEDENGDVVCTLPEIEAHEHSAECYQPQQVLVCGETQGDDHTHSNACYEEQNVLVCNNTAVLHRHDENCYDGSGKLICGQLEVLEHQHEDSCFVQTEKSNDETGESDDGTEESNAEINFMAVDDSSEKSANNTSTEPVRLMEYAKTISNGKVQITVSKGKDQLPPNENGGYDVVAGETYNVRVAYSGNKIDVGRYYVTFTSVANIDLTQNGTLSLNTNENQTVDVGTWHFEEQQNGVVWLVFDIQESGNIEHYSSIDLVADVTCEFDYVDQPLEFDGIITVNVIRPPAEKTDTEIGKWAENNTDPNKIVWKAGIIGHQNSEIPGSTFHDAIETTETHYYTEEDKEKGITITAGISGSKDVSDWHQWVVKPGDPGLSWTETEWSYTMPECIECEVCHETITLGSDGWEYYLEYTSTRKQKAEDGYVVYKNKIEFDGKEAEGKTSTSPVSSTGEVVKTGTYSQGDEATYEDDVFNWTITTKIPGAREGEKYDYFWYLWDSMAVKQEGSSDTYYQNDLGNPTSVTVKIAGEEGEIDVPNWEDADASIDRFAWYNDWTDKKEVNGKEIPYGQQISLVTSCQCTEENCREWNFEQNKCQGALYYNGYCRCWSYPKDVTFTLTYQTKATELIEEYGGQSARLQNYVFLANKQQDTSGTWHNIVVDDETVRVPIPGIFTKQITGDPVEGNGFVAEYTITVNEAMADLSKQLQDLTIKDTMTTTLGFMSGSLKIYAENKNGDKWEVPSDQYTVKYEPNVEDSETQKKGNLLTVTLKNETLGPYKYTMVYGTSVKGGSGNLSYSNTASINMFGTTYDVGGGARDVPAAAISGKTYGATVYKHESGNKDKALPGAKFGLYTENGTLMQTYETNDEGVFQVQTDTRDEVNVILYTHVLYYLQELEAPEGYQLDTKRHYFWFCDNEDTVSCSKSDEYGSAEYNATCVYTFKTDENTVDLTISNKPIPDDYELPETGGSGTAVYTIGGIAVMAAALMYYINRRRKGEM